MKSNLVDLPHDATLNMSTSVVSFPLGSITINLTLEEWLSFAEIVDDITTVIQVNTVENVAQCPTCNTISSYIQYEEPSESDVN